MRRMKKKSAQIRVRVRGGGSSGGRRTEGEDDEKEVTGLGVLRRGLRFGAHDALCVGGETGCRVCARLRAKLYPHSLRFLLMDG